MGNEHGAWPGAAPASAADGMRSSASGLSLSNKIVAGFLLAVVLAYGALFIHFSPLALQDNPNHLARAAILADLIYRHGQIYGHAFSYHFLAIPYVLGDLLIATLAYLVGPAAAWIVWTLLAFLALPGALLVYSRAKRATPTATLLLLLLSIYFSTDAFFVLGFLSFRLGVAFVFLGLGVVELLRQRWTGPRFVLYTVIVAAGYLTHFASVVFLAAALGATAFLRVVILRTSRIQREACLLLPLIGVFAWHFLVASGYREPHDDVAEAYEWGPLSKKALQLGWEFVRYNAHADVWMMVAFVAILLACLFGASWNRRAFLNLNVLEPWAVAATFLALYVIFPFSYSEASFVDVRALAYLPALVAIGVVSLPAKSVSLAARMNLLAMGGAAVLLVLNLAYLDKHLRIESERMVGYRAVLASVPGNAWVLPVYTAPKEGVARPALHFGSFAVLDRHALIPYLFTADTGAPVKYFRYLHLPYAPYEEWYRGPVRGDVRSNEKVAWSRVAANYAYLLVTKPYDPARIPIRTHVVTENREAALLAVH
jgi:hypothetical protein